MGGRGNGREGGREGGGGVDIPLRSGDKAIGR